MSERMIEIQRAKLGLPPVRGGTASASIKSLLEGRGGKSIKQNDTVDGKNQPTHANVAAASLLSEDAQMERFLNLLWKYNKNCAYHHHGGSMIPSTGPTVPTALSRRMLHRQGVGYLDDTIASVVSAQADRFLATVLQQAIACRAQRLKGADMARKSLKQRKSYTQNYHDDINERKRRKDAIGHARETIAVHTIAVAEAVRKRGAGGKLLVSNTTTTTKTITAAENKTATTKKVMKKKKGKKPESPVYQMPTGPGVLDPTVATLAKEQDEGYESIDQEEEYYRNNVVEIPRERIQMKKGDGDGDNEDDDDYEEDDDDTLLLRDIVRPLEAWNFHLNGKESVINNDTEQDDNTNDLDDEEKNNAQQQSTEKLNDDNKVNAATDTKYSDNNGDD